MDNKLVNILIVDDDVNARLTFGNIMKLKGYTVETAATASEAIFQIKNKFFNIIFIDIRLPDASGLEVLKSVKKMNGDTMAIMVTAYASIDSSIEAMNQGAYSYIMKPVNMDYLQIVLEKALEKQRLSLENKRLLQELKKANKKLTEMDRLKSAFVAMVSHEFKNPLMAINLSLDYVFGGMAGEINTKQKKYLTIGKNEIQRLIRLVTDLLDISRIEAGKMDFKKEQIEILPLINEVITIYEDLAAKKQISLTVTIKQDIGSVCADKDKLTQVLINLLDNAIKFTPTKGKVIIVAFRNDEEVRFEIFNTGAGIPEKDLLKIFDKFERITAESEEGTGLGLPIAKNIIELHQGRMWVESKPGQGSKFIFVLPA